MKKQNLLNYYKKQLVNFQKYFYRVEKSQKASDIHKLRLSVKRIRTLLSFVENNESSIQYEKEISGMLSVLFKKTGIVRENQLNLKMISRRRLLYIQPFREYLESNNEQAIDDLLKEMKVFNMDLFLVLCNELLLRIKSMTNEQIHYHLNNYIAAKLESVAYFLKEPGDHQLHKIRKHIKRTVELIALQSKKKQVNWQSELKKTFKQLDELIGKWHDYSILIGSIKLFERQVENRKVRSYLKRVIWQFEKKRTLIKNTIWKMLTEESLVSG